MRKGADAMLFRTFGLGKTVAQRRAFICMGDVSTIRQAYEADGFYINAERRLPPDLVSRAAEGLMSIRRGEYDTGRAPEDAPAPSTREDVLCKIEMPQFANKAVRELVGHPLIGQVAAEATGADWVQVWWVQLLYKPPSTQGAGATTNVGWHQDRNYWQRWDEGSELFTAWVALSDVTAASGPMIFARGSHKWGLMTGSDFWGQDLAGLKNSIRIPEGEKWEEVPALLPPGGFSLHDDLTWHGSAQNYSDRPRLSFAIHMRTQSSRPVDDSRKGLDRYIDDHSVCPVYYARADRA
jgi:hypothetical protein